MHLRDIDPDQETAVHWGVSDLHKS